MIKISKKTISTLLALYIYGFMVFSLLSGSVSAEPLDEICKLLPDCVGNNNNVDDTIEQSASYALGVKFQREVASRFTDIQYDYFIRGIKDAKNSLVTKSSSALNATLDSVIMSKSDQSKKFLKEFIASDDALSIKGIYVKKNIPSDSIKSLEIPECYSKIDDKSVFRIAYVRLQLDKPSERNKWAVGATQEDCIGVAESEVIRGWRTALNEMENNQVWEVVIPPELGYGGAGLKSSTGKEMLVDKDVALRFVLQLVNKPPLTLGQKLAQTVEKIQQ